MENISIDDLRTRLDEILAESVMIGLIVKTEIENEGWYLNPTCKSDE